MSLNPRVCKKSYKVHIPMMGEACEFWLITVTDEQSITNPDKDHAYLTDDGKLFVFNGDSLVRVNCDICFTQEEREKLEGIEEGANKYVLPVATDKKLGGVLLGYTQNGRNYPITKDTKGNIYVNVPWEEYQLPKATDNALGGIKTGYNQNGKFYPIKTDTDGNAYVQVPWEDTNTVYEVVSKTSNGLMPMLPSDENASKRFLNGDGEWVVGTDNSINGVTQTGSTFSGETSDCGVEITKVVGKTVQQTTNGYQLFDASKIATKSQGGATVTNNGDGSFTVTGSGSLTANLNTGYILSHDDFVKIFKTGNLHATVEKSLYPSFCVNINQNGAFKKVILNTSDSTEKTGELLQEYFDDSSYSLQIGFDGATRFTIQQGTIKPMLYQDGDGTWEPFTGGKPAPNPDYPMPIENVEITEIYSTNDYNTDDNVELSRVYLNNKGEELYDTVTWSISKYITIPSGFDKLIAKGMSGGIPSICFYDESKKFISGEAYNNRLNFDISIPENAKFFRFSSVISNRKNEHLFVSSYNYNAIETSLTLAEGDTYQNGQVTIKRKKLILDGDESIGGVTDLGTTIRFSYSIGNETAVYPNEKNYCNRFKQIFNFTLDEEHYYVSSNTIIIFIDKSRLSSYDIEGIKSYLKSHPLEVEYELATPTTEEFKVPTIPSYEPYTEISTNSVVDPTIIFRPLPFTTCLVGEATEEESGYMPPLSGNSNEFLNGNGQWATPPNTTYGVATTSKNGLMSSSDKTKLTNLRRIWKGTSSSPPSGWVDGDIYVQYEE